jgi:hypothetical protein
VVLWNKAAKLAGLYCNFFIVIKGRSESTLLAVTHAAIPEAASVVSAVRNRYRVFPVDFCSI